MSWVLRINGLTDEQLGLRLVGTGNPWGPASRSRTTVPVPGWEGRALARTSEGDVRATAARLVLAGSIADRRSKLDLLLDRLHGLLEVEWADDPGKVRRCVLDQIVVEEREARSFTAADTGLAVLLNLIEEDPVRWSRESSVIEITSTPTPVPMGNAVSIPVMRFPGAFTDVTVTRRDFAGTSVAQITVNVSPGADDYLEIDGGTFGSPAIVLATGGVRDVQNDLKADDGGRFFALEPKHNDRARGFFGTIEATQDGVLEYAEVDR